MTHPAVQLAEPTPGIGHNRSPEPPDPVAAVKSRLTDFVAQCQMHLRQAERAHKVEKAFFLQAGRAVDGFFKRRCETLNDALTPVMARLKAYRDRVMEAASAQHQAVRQAAEASWAASICAAASCAGLVMVGLTRHWSPPRRRLHRFR
jgi:hypothetical protein